MNYYDELTSFPVSGVPKEMAERFKFLCRRMGQSRSSVLKMMMESALNNAQWWFEKESTLKQFVGHSVNDTFSTFGMNFAEKKSLEKELDKAA